jgi:two-component system sensor histidine kinase PilS (NtrC family)
LLLSQVYLFSQIRLILTVPKRLIQLLTPYAGILGAGFFTLALLSYFLAKRTEQTELIATQQKQTILSLEELNQYIIQNMQSGIIITNREQEITRYNEACPRLLGISRLPKTLADISPNLATAFTHQYALRENRTTEPG